eukprot:4833625-Prymnesium_polylepis.1
MTTAAVRRTPASRAAAALRATPLVVSSSRARSCHRARRDITVVHVPPASDGGFPPTPTASSNSRSRRHRLPLVQRGSGGDARLRAVGCSSCSVSSICAAAGSEADAGAAACSGFCP